VDKVIVTVLLIIAGVVCTMVIVNAVYPMITRSSGAIIDTASKIEDRIKSQVEIIGTADESSDVHVWVKNVGASSIGGIEQCDIFFGPEGNFERIPYGEAGADKPYWNYTIENNSKWIPTATVKITIYLSSSPSGNYFIKVVIPNGIADEKIYST
jgi:archaellum component FlaF (FlaF/FlaG flagellin family)